jgi:hypothetical protein
MNIKPTTAIKQTGRKGCYFSHTILVAGNRDDERCTKEQSYLNEIIFCDAEHHSPFSYEHEFLCSTAT